MSEAILSSTHSDTGEVFLITKDDGLYLDTATAVDLSTLSWDQDVPHIDSIKHACKVLDTLLEAAPRTIGCIFKLDGLQFADMRSSVLRAGIVVLAVGAGHSAIIAPISTRLPAANRRSEFIFRASRGIRLLKPALSEQELLQVLTREIQFFEEQVLRESAELNAHWREASYQAASTARTY